MYVLKVLLVLVDTDDHHSVLRELNIAAIKHNFTLMLSWSHEETARYLETYKAFEFKPDDLIREKMNAPAENDYVAKMTDCLTNVRTVNKTDVLTLLSTFGSFQAITQASTAQIALCPGFGEVKVKDLQQALSQPFVTRDSSR